MKKKCKPELTPEQIEKRKLWGQKMLELRKAKRQQQVVTAESEKSDIEDIEIVCKNCGIGYNKQEAINDFGVLVCPKCFASK